MQEKHLFEYAVIRVVPRVEREEFLNVGVILYCKQQKFLHLKFVVDARKLTAFCASCNVDEIEDNLQALNKICNGEKNGGPIALLDAPSRFRWITAAKSTVVQASKVHPGLCIDANQTLDKLFAQLVL
ncbi:DUF3037 domain-containing protein [Mucilaginibacter ginkgonis]|uniref:DUF3037 domain-containing protein n=1 Tax=Mucilaginibacter ginkgonis TaxID=2682091 RepID=A0A6I4I236_9SPHI|nr:DUF3037 domain-containing protein [Mucilaginibacter ginkgonis]QQL50748.1 DUF3037 domain-containing protein [Mucilaginibacter ginkgonis]